MSWLLLSASGAAMAFTYVPVPVYNMAGMAIPGMQGQPSAFPNMSGLGVMSPGSMAPQGMIFMKEVLIFYSTCRKSVRPFIFQHKEMWS